MGRPVAAPADRRADLIELHARDHAVAIPGTITRSDKPSFGPT
jgi:hypothetical protein